MEYITEQMIREAIVHMKDEFDSHDVIRWIMRKYPKEYANQLCEYNVNNDKDPFPILHSQISQVVGRTTLVAKTTRKISTNARLSDTENQGWRKKN